VGAGWSGINLTNHCESRGLRHLEAVPGKRKNVWDRHAHTAVFKMDNQQGLTVEHRELCSMLCVSLNGRESGGEWIHVYEWLSPFAVHLNCHNIFCLSAIL